MQTLLQKEEEDTKLNVVCHGQKHLHTTYQYYSTQKFRFFCLVVLKNIALKFPNDRGRKIFKDVK
jgi:hypothetical protein